MIIFRCTSCHDVQRVQGHQRRCKCGGSGALVCGGRPWAWGSCEVEEVVESREVEGVTWLAGAPEGEVEAPATREEARVLLAGALGVEPMRVGLNELIAMAVPLLRRG